MERVREGDELDFFLLACILVRIRLNFLACCIIFGSPPALEYSAEHFFFKINKSRDRATRPGKETI